MTELTTGRRRTRLTSRFPDPSPQPADGDLWAGEIVKTDPAKQNVFGWAYVAISKDGQINYDHSGDFVDDLEELEGTAYDFVLKSRASDADHSNVQGGTLIESIVFTPEKIEKMGLPVGSVPLGWWIGFHLDDAGTWDRVEKGELTSFSVHGKGIRTPVAYLED
jgi:hypothetical protein